MLDRTVTLKTLLVVALVLVMALPQVTSAAWWNPFSWFTSDTETTTEVSTSVGLAIGNSEANSRIETEATTTASVQERIIEKVVEKKVVQNDPEGTSRINALVNENAELQAQLTSLQKKIQDNENEKRSFLEAINAEFKKIVILQKQSEANFNRMTSNFDAAMTMAENSVSAYNTLKATCGASSYQSDAILARANALVNRIQSEPVSRPIVSNCNFDPTLRSLSCTTN